MSNTLVAPNGLYAPNVSSHFYRDFRSRSCSLPMSFVHSSPLQCLPILKSRKPLHRLPVLKSRKPLHLCFAGGQGMMENSGDFQRKSLEEAMGQLKGRSIEDVLREQIEKGGSGGKPPGGRGGGGGSGNSSGSDGMSDENLQVVLATVSFILMYIFVINGLELIKLARDCIKFLSGRGQSVRLKRAVYKWVRAYKNIMERMKALKNGLEKASTCWFHPDFVRGVLRRHYMKSNPEE